MGRQLIYFIVKKLSHFLQTLLCVSLQLLQILLQCSIIEPVFCICCKKIKHLQLSTLAISDFFGSVDTSNAPFTLENHILDYSRSLAQNLPYI